MSKLWKVALWTGQFVAYVAAAGAVVFCLLIARTAWSGATPPGQISVAILAGCAIIAGAVYTASRRPPENLTLVCDRVDGLDVNGVGGKVYILAPNATRVQEIHRSTPSGEG